MDAIPFIDFPGFIACVDNMWHRKNAANPCRNVGAAVAIGIDVVKLTNKIKFEVSLEDGFAPYINETSFVTGEKKFSPEPFVTDAFVERT